MDAIGDEHSATESANSLAGKTAVQRHRAGDVVKADQRGPSRAAPVRDV